MFSNGSRSLSLISLGIQRVVNRREGSPWKSSGFCVVWYGRLKLLSGLSSVLQLEADARMLIFDDQTVGVKHSECNPRVVRELVTFVVANDPVVNLGSRLL